MKRIRLLPLLWLSLLLSASVVWAQQSERVAIPALTARVIDTTQTLDAAQTAQLEAQLASIEQTQGSQIVALIVATTQPEDIASFALRVGREWKIGRRDVGDGVLIIIAKQDRKLRIEVAKKLEGAIPDLAAKQIIDEALAPALRQGNYSQGIAAAATALQQRIASEKLPAPSASAQSGFDPQQFGFEWMDFFIFLLFAVPIGGAVAKGIFGNKLGSLVTGGAVGGVAFFITASMVIAGLAFFAALIFTLISSFGRSTTGRRGYSRGYDGGSWSSGGGGGWSSGDGGGFSSGGGGDFGGGGASGDF